MSTAGAGKIAQTEPIMHPAPRNIAGEVMHLVISALRATQPAPLYWAVEPRRSAPSISPSAQNRKKELKWRRRLCQGEQTFDSRAGVVEPPRPAAKQHRTERFYPRDISPPICLHKPLRVTAVCK